MMEMAPVVPCGAGLDPRRDRHLMWGRLARMRGAAVGIVGTLIHLGVSAAIGVLYAVAFALADVRNVASLWGLVGASIHWTAAGVFMGAVFPRLHPDVPHGHPRPGFFVTRLGRADFGAFLVGHLLYGLTFGTLYPYLWAGGGADLAW